MTKSRPNNSVIFLATLGVYLGLVLAGATQVFSQTNGAAIDKRPMQNVGISLIQAVKAKKVDLNAQFLVAINVSVNKNGKLDQNATKVIRSEGNGESGKIIIMTIAALNESGYFQYLSSAGIKEGMIVVKQDNSVFAAQLTTALRSDSDAKTLASGVNTLIGLLTAKKATPKADANDIRDIELIQSVRVQSNAKTLILSFDMPKATFQQMLVSELLKLSK